MKYLQTKILRPFLIHEFLALDFHQTQLYDRQCHAPVTQRSMFL